jgi:hypothetical protein
MRKPGVSAEKELGQGVTNPSAANEAEPGSSPWGRDKLRPL